MGGSTRDSTRSVGMVTVKDLCLTGIQKAEAGLNKPIHEDLLAVGKQ